ncbi:MAG: phosphatidylinositol kinase, partial [Actinomycetota bacterium]
ALLADVERFAGDLRSGPVREELSALLSAAEIDAMAERAHAVVAAGAYPGPGPGRPFPWPPV